MVTQDKVDFIYRQYKINCVTQPTLYNTNYDQKCPKFTSLLQTMLTNGQKPSDLTDDAYNSLLTTLGVKVTNSMTDLGNRYTQYKMYCKSTMSVNADADRTKCDLNRSYLVSLFRSEAVVDTIGVNKNDPTKWVIPDGEFRPFLTELGISEPYKPNIIKIIKTRRDVKSILYNLKKTTGIGGKTKRRRSSKIRKSSKSRKHYKRKRSRQMKYK